MLIIMLIICSLFLFIYVTFFKKLVGRKYPTKIIPKLKKYTLIYRGNHAAKVFISYKFKIRAKPDFIYQSNNGELAIVEFKSRKGNVTHSDIHQLIATAIAVSENLPNLTKGFIYTRGGYNHAIDLNKPVFELLKMINKEIKYVRDFKTGYPIKFRANKYTCNVCLYNSNCYFRSH